MLDKHRKNNKIDSSALAVVGILFALLLTSTCAEPRAWPNWNAETSAGKRFHSKNFEGKVAVISIWASWCPSCRRQLPILNSLQNTLGSESIQVLAFSFDRTERAHSEYVEKSGMKVSSIYARSGEGLKVVKEIQKGAGRLEAVPTLLIYDKQGRLVHRLVGFVDRGKLEDLLRPLKAETRETKN